MKKALSNIREFFWPLLEGSSESIEDNEEEDLDLIISDDNLEEAFKLNLRIYDGEKDRRKGIETKASLFISTISVATSIVVAANTLITRNQEFNLQIKISVLITFILSLYAVRTVWFSIKTLERGSYSVLDIQDINIGGDKPQYYKNLIQSLQRKTTKNQTQINSKVDYFTLAQEYYKRAIIVICVYAFLILLFCFFFKKNSTPALQIVNIEISKAPLSDSSISVNGNLPKFHKVNSDNLKCKFDFMSGK